MSEQTQERILAELKRINVRLHSVEQHLSRLYANIAVNEDRHRKDFMHRPPRHHAYSDEAVEKHILGLARGVFDALSPYVPKGTQLAVYASHLRNEVRKGWEDGRYTNREVVDDYNVVGAIRRDCARQIVMKETVTRARINEAARKYLNEKFGGYL